MDDIKQLCVELVSESTLNQQTKAAWLERLHHSDVTQAMFLQLQQEFLKSHEARTAEIDHQLQDVVNQINTTAQDFNIEFAKLSADTNALRKTTTKKKEEQMLADIRGKLGL